MSEFLKLAWDNASVYHVITKPSWVPLIMTTQSNLVNVCVLFSHFGVLGFCVLFSLSSSFIFNKTSKASFVYKALFAFKIAF